MYNINQNDDRASKLKTIYQQKKATDNQFEMFRTKKRFGYLENKNWNKKCWSRV